jgi:hypothetical protein
MEAKGELRGRREDEEGEVDSDLAGKKELSTSRWYIAESLRS